MLDLISAGTLPCAAPIWGSTNGQVKLTLSYSSQERQLMVVVHACRCVCSPSSFAWHCSFHNVLKGSNILSILAAFSGVQRSAAPKQRCSGQLRLPYAAARQKQGHQKENGSEEARPESWVQWEVIGHLDWLHTSMQLSDLLSHFSPSFAPPVRFEYDLPLDELRFRRLSVTVKNNSASFRSRDVIGQVGLDSDLRQHCTRCTTRSCTLMLTW